MTKNEWMIMKCKELNNNLFFGSFSGNNLILEQLEDSNPELLFNEINKLYHIDTSQYDYKVTIRTTGANYYQNWHLDGKRVFETRNGVICPSDANNQSKYVLHNIFSPTPTYSILYYGSSYNVDFKGGIIEFINGQKIKPMKNNSIIFDSNLGHRVTQQTDGERKCFLIMLFKKSS